MRLHAMGQPNYRNGFRVTCHDHVLDLPLRWRKPQMVFTNSMGDLFHEDVPLPFIKKVFGVMNQAHLHCFQVLTKRSGRLSQLSDKLKWSQNIWMGVTVENEGSLERIEDLKKTKAVVKFLSVEPLLGPIPDIKLKGIDWVIVGGESGPGARPMDVDWVLDLRDQCLSADVPFFFKQWGGVKKKEAGRLLEDRTWDEMPDVEEVHQLELV